MNLRKVSFVTSLLMAHALIASAAAVSPTLSPAAGSYSSVQDITISSSTSGATIYWTLDGSTPTTSSNKYTSPVWITYSQTLRAIAVSSSGSSSSVVSGYYQIGPAPAASSIPIFSPGPGDYVNVQAVKISDPNSGAAIYWTLDGSTPTESSTRYTSPVWITYPTQTLRAIAVANGTTSAVVSGTYAITSQTQSAAPTFSLPAGAYAGAESVSLLDATSGAILYYTTNGSTPTTSSSKYSSPIYVSASETIKAMAVSSTNAGSAVSSASYTIQSQAQAATPTFSPAPGSYSSTQYLVLSDSTSGATVYYTTDGSTPTTSSAKYNYAIPVTSSATIKTMATANGYANSTVASGSFNISSVDASVFVNQNYAVGPVTDQILGMNMAYWYNPATPAIIPAFQTAGIKALRWPGGSNADYYHWQTHSLCKSDYLASNSDFTSVSQKLFLPGNFSVSITANYGTNESCNGGGDPYEAAAWVGNAKSLGVNATYWTVGNESFGSWETDLHSAPHDPGTYASALANGYYPQMKAANPNILVGVPVDAGYVNPSWDPTVLSQAKYDYVEYHYYPEDPYSESDSYLVNQAAQQLTMDLNIIKSQLSAAGHSNTPIYVGELGATDTNPGKQSETIAQALFAGQALGEMMNAGVARSTWWIGFGGCSNPSSGNFSSSIYGWNTFGGYMVFSDGLPAAGCPAAPYLAAGTLLPTARAYQLFSNVAKAGEQALQTTVSGDSSNIRAYSATSGNGAVLVVFNLNEYSSETVSVTLSEKTESSAVTMLTYDKAAYDQSQYGGWSGLTTTNLGPKSLPLNLTLTPWSMNVVLLPR